MKTGKFLAAASALTLAAVSYAQIETVDVSAIGLYIYSVEATIENSDFYIQNGDTITKEMLIENGLKVKMRMGAIHDMLEDPLYGEWTPTDTYYDCFYDEFGVYFPETIVEGENNIEISCYDSLLRKKVYGTLTINVHISRRYDTNSDGKITSYDAWYVLKAITGNMEEEENKFADVDGDGEITSYDALIILYKIAGIDIYD